MNPTLTIRIAAAIVKDARGQMLVVRKRGTKVFIQPGGKIEPGESPTEALQRELREELSCSPGRMKFCGRFSAPAANEPDHIVEAEIYAVDLNGTIAPAAEIVEMQWIDPKNPGSLELAPLTAKHVVPLAAGAIEAEPAEISRHGKSNP